MRKPPTVTREMSGNVTVRIKGIRHDLSKADVIDLAAALLKVLDSFAKEEK